MNKFELPKANISEDELRHWDELASQLEALNSKKKNPHPTVVNIIRSLRLGYIDSARNVCWTEMDKFSLDKDLALFLREKLFAGQADKPWPYLAKEK